MNVPGGGCEERRRVQAWRTEGAIRDANSPTALFDVTRDGKRFLMLTAAEQEPSALMTVVVNWHAGLKK